MYGQYDLNVYELKKLNVMYIFIYIFLSFKPLFFLKLF